MIVRILRFHFTELASLKNMSQGQVKVFQQLVQTRPGFQKKQLNLVAYLVQRLKPLIEPYKEFLALQIEKESIVSNQDLDLAIKVLYDYIKMGLDQNKCCTEFCRQFSSEIEKHRIQQELHQLTAKGACDYTAVVQQLTIFHPSFDSILLAQLVQQHFNRSQCAQLQQVYQKIQTFTPREIPEQQNSYQQMQQHLQKTHGRIVLRFPPEPNGYLHLGHVRSIRLNFHSAEQLNGVCYLRYDDTNPQCEKQQFIDQIEENVRWFGHNPTNITYASDYFDFLFDCAIKLIKDNKAFVCEQSRDDMHEYRRLKRPSPHRDRDAKTSLEIFQNMQLGLYPESKYTLRLKIDYQHSNPTLRDPVIYRVLYHPHPRSGLKWKVYPMYDFAHCICDSLENITHSLCTLEFEIRRELYYWILTNLNLFKPLVYEFSRLNVSRNMLSKRRIAKLVEKEIVSGWDDPRLLTLAGLKRRGYTPTAINNFIDQVSVPRSGNEQLISMKLLEACIRKELDLVAPKVMAVVDPVRCRIVNFELKLQASVPYNQNNKGLGHRQITLSGNIYLERKDIKLQDEPDYYGIAPNKKVSLKYFGLFECVHINVQHGQIDSVELRLVSTELQDRKSVKGQLHWIAEEDSITREVYEYGDLFSIENPGESENYLECINHESLRVFRSRIPNLGFQNAQRFQFERMGYYIFEDGHFNKIVGLLK